MAISKTSSSRKVRHDLAAHINKMTAKRVAKNLAVSAESRLMQRTKKSESGCWLWKGKPNSSGYGRISFHGTEVYAHRLSFETFVGPIPDGMLIDHKCHVKTCINPSHLRVVTMKENLENRSSLNSNNTSGFRGVYKTRSGSWAAQIRDDNEIKFIGAFKSLEEANSASLAARNDSFTHNDIDRVRDEDAA